MTRKSLRKTTKPGKPAGTGKVLTHAKPLIAALRKGLPVSVACHMADVNVSTYHEWLKLGDQGKTKVYVDFARDARAARAAYADEMVDVIEAAARSDPRNWTAGAWLLERMYPNDFGRRNPDVAVAIQNNNSQVTVNSSELKKKMEEYSTIWEDNAENKQE